MGTISIMIATYSSVAAGVIQFPDLRGSRGPREVTFLGPPCPLRSIMRLFGPDSGRAGDSRMAQAVGPDHRPLSRLDGEWRGLERGNAAGVGRRRVGEE